MKYLILGILVSTYFSVKSQSIDSALIKCTYELTYLPDSTKPDKFKKDILTLFVGRNTSLFFSYINFRADSAFKADIEEGNITLDEVSKNKDLQKKYTKAGFYSNCFLLSNYQTNTIEITDRIGNDKYYYYEEIEKIKWIIEPDTLTILGYACQKAIATFRGRNYVSWFASELPINSGPYKFQGLPGLILEIMDTKNNYKYNCIGLEKLSNSKQLIVIEKNGYTKTSRIEFRKAFKASFDNPWQTLTGGGNITISGPNVDQMKAMLQKGIAYNPIELE